MGFRSRLVNGETMRQFVASAGFLLLGSLAACSTVTSGVGTASTPNGQLRANMSWVSQGGRHGTMTAGCVAAIANNGMGVAGVAPNAKVIPVKVGNSASSVVEAMMPNTVPSDNR